MNQWMHDVMLNDKAIVVTGGTTRRKGLAVGE